MPSLKKKCNRYVAKLEVMKRLHDSLGQVLPVITPLRRQVAPASCARLMFAASIREF
jgi:hypothetical protein